MRNWFAAISIMLLTHFMPSLTWAKAPVPIVDGYVVEGFEGWEKLEQRTADGNGMQYMHRPKVSSPHKGSALWFYAMEGTDKRSAFIESAKAGGITDLKVLGSYTMKKAVLLDNRGSGEAFIAEGTRNGKGPYKIAALVIHGSLDKSEEPRLGVHMFVAPRELYGGMGGWVVPASLFLNLDPQKDVSDTLAQGNAAPALQAQRLAGIADVWAEWVLNEYIRMAQSNIQALSNARQSIVCAGDPSCEIVPSN